MKNILIIGSGGREHAIADAFNCSAGVAKTYVLPGNPGMANSSPSHSKILPVAAKTNSFDDIYRIVIEKQIDLVFVGPEQPLAQGIVDYLENKNIPIIGPDKSAARLEASKIFAKDLMVNYDIPTAKYRSFNDIDEAVRYLQQVSLPVVIKADGLAAGKGVIIADSLADAEIALQKMMQQHSFGDAGTRVVIEEYLQGEEASIFAFTDGEGYQLTIFSQDYKKLSEGDKGPNTGGMGAFAPVDKFERHTDTVDKAIFKPLFKALKKENIVYKGILYAGLIFTDDGPHVLEFNCRLGDPEAQVLLPLLKTDMLDICDFIIKQKVKDLQLKWMPGYAVNVVAASKGYPSKYEKFKPLIIDEKFFEKPYWKIFAAGVSQAGRKLGNEHQHKNSEARYVTSGGRVLSVTAVGETLTAARARAYEGIKKIDFEGMVYRTDIAQA